MAYTEKDWIHRPLQFVFGAVVGAIAGVMAWRDFSEELPVWLCAAIGALVLGVAAAVVGDKLWHAIFERFRGW